MNNCDECLNNIKNKSWICEYCVDKCLYSDSGTYGDLLNKFKEKYPSLADNIIDYRPCMEPFFEYYIPGAIIVYLKNEGKLLYISENLISYPIAK